MLDRTASWSRPRRRLLVFLLSCALLCGGIVVGASLVRIIGKAIAANRGAPTPAAAMDTSTGSQASGLAPA